MKVAKVILMKVGKLLDQQMEEVRPILVAALGAMLKGTDLHHILSTPRLLNVLQKLPKILRNLHMLRKLLLYHGFKKRPNKKNRKFK